MARNGKGRTASMTDIIDIFGKSQPTIVAYIKEGMPFIERGAKGKEWQFSTLDVHDWLCERRMKKMTGTTTPMGAIDEANLRNKIATAQLKEYELARIRGQTVVIADVMPVVEECFSSVRARILSIPGRLAQELANETDAAAVERAIKREVSDALSELSIDPRAIRPRDE